MLNENTKNLYGIKYASPLINLPFFDIIQGFLPDYLHCCLEGVADQFLNYFMELLSNDNKKEIDENLKKIRAPRQIGRLTRPISNKNDWKARELENFVLYYSLPVLSKFLRKKNFEHWLLFVEGLYILLQDKLHISELERADLLFHRFVYETENLYGVKAMTYNLHLLLHISESVANWGPLWTNSTFSFESQNYYLLKAIKSSNGVTQQLVRHVNIVHSMFVVENFVGRTAQTEVVQYCTDVLTARIKHFYRKSENVYFIPGSKNNEFIRSMKLKNSTTFYYKLVKNKCLYESCLKDKERSNNFIVLLSDKRFAVIYGFTVSRKNKEKCICSLITVKNFSNDFKKMFIIEKIEEEKITIYTKIIEKVCVIMNVYNINYICPVPNLIHY